MPIPRQIERTPPYFTRDRAPTTSRFRGARLCVRLGWVFGWAFGVMASGCATNGVSQSADPAVAAEASTEAEAAKVEKGPLQVALSFDDLPTHGPLPPGQSRLDIHRHILDVLDAHKVPGVIGFVNANALDQRPDHRAALQLWLERGHPLGNHTYSHPHASRIPVEAYIEDIARNEASLRSLHGEDSPESSWKYFRYPFLSQGGSAERRGAIRSWLAEHGYQISHTSIDFADYAWNEPYVRCLARDNQEAVQSLKDGYVAFALAALEWSDAAAQQAFGRRVPQVLLLHVGTFNTAVLDQMLSAYEKAGVEFISMDQAMKDPVYQLDLPTHNEWDGTIIDQYISTQGVEPVAWPVRPESLLSAACR